MRRLVQRFARRIVRRLALAVALCGCGPSMPTPAQQAGVLRYEDAMIDAQSKCVDDAKTIEESHACRARARAEVNARFGRDGGAP